MLRLLLDWGRPKPSHAQRSFLVAGKFQKQRGAQHGAATKTKVKEAATGKSLSDLHGKLRPPQKKMILFFINEETNDSHQLFFARFKRKLSCFENQGKFCCADAKLDTNKAKCPLSAIVTRTSRSTVYTCAFWIATKENQQVTAQVGQRFLGYLPSGKPGCGCERISSLDFLAL